MLLGKYLDCSTEHFLNKNKNKKMCRQEKYADANQPTLRLIAVTKLFAAYFFDFNVLLKMKFVCLSVKPKMQNIFII